MGTQTMASQTGGRRPSPVRGLARQGSLYSLTLNEVQSHLGEPLHSMNLDDLLESVLAADGNSQSSPAGPCGLNRALSKKTVDEVWRDIQQQQKKKKKKNNGGRSSELGETTLEDFLMKAGVVAQGPHWLHQYQHYLPGRPVTQALGVGSSCALLETVGAISNPLTPGRKRGAREYVEEETVDRRRKRMIKNRESAARSRARKQAYTNELENKVSRLEEENERLRKQKELDTMLHFAPSPEPMHQLRRSISASF